MAKSIKYTVRDLINKNIITKNTLIRAYFSSQGWSGNRNLIREDFFTFEECTFNQDGKPVKMKVRRNSNNEVRIIKEEDIITIDGMSIDRLIEAERDRLRTVPRKKPGRVPKHLKEQNG